MCVIDVLVCMYAMGDWTVVILVLILFAVPQQVDDGSISRLCVFVCRGQTALLGNGLCQT